MNEEGIIRELKRHFATSDYKLSNVFIWDWESDFFCLTSSGYAMEVEVKISRGDFKADMKKTQKHFILRNAGEEEVDMPVHSWSGSQTMIRKVRPKSPNKFFYCCPATMIKPEEIPEYAGLLWFDPEHEMNSIQTVKPAKWLHKNKQDLSRVLLDKYYYLYLNLMHEYRSMAHFADRIRDTYAPEKDLPELDKKAMEGKAFYEPTLFDNLTD